MKKYTTRIYYVARKEADHMQTIIIINLKKAEVGEVVE